MTTLELAWLSFLGAICAGGIVLYVCVVRPALRELDDDMGNPWERF